MPKIEAPTVAEHNRRRRAALLRAAESLLAQNGIEAVTLGAVGQAAGLARSSVYQYFDSSAALVAAVVEDLMPRSAEHLASETAQAREPAARVEAFIRAALRTATEPTHRALAALAGASLPPEGTARLAELHRAQEAPLRTALVELAIPDPELTATLLMGAVKAAVQAVVGGESTEVVTERTLALVRGALAGCRVHEGP